MNAPKGSFTAFVTIHALTSGIEEWQVVESQQIAGMVRSTALGVPHDFYGEGKAWHRTRDQAVKRAEEMRQRKVSSLKRALSNMEQIEFS